MNRLNRSQIKSDVGEQLRSAQVSPKGMTALYLGLILLLNVLVHFCSGAGLFSMFFSTLAQLMSVVLDGGFVLYCLAVRRNERFEYLSLFDGFSFAGKLIVLYFVRSAYIFLWSMLLVVPGIMAYYRYRFAVYCLLEDPDMSVMEALHKSSRLTYGYKQQLFQLDLSYLGWALLSAVPLIASEAYTLASVTDFTAYMATPATLPAILLQGIWSLLVSMFYYPNYICADLVYYEDANTAFRPAEDPDGLGGF